jgi:small conductance mechanosensitive channel
MFVIDGERPSRIFPLVVVAVAAALGAAPAKAQEAASRPAVSASAPQPTKPGERTEAERIVGLRRLLAADQQQRDALKKEQARLGDQFDQASAGFEQLDSQLVKERGRLQQITDSTQKAAQQEAVAGLEARWTEGRDRFDLVIQRRRAVEQETLTLADKIAFEQQILDGLINLTPAAGASPPASQAPVQPSKPEKVASPAPVTAAPKTSETGQETVQLDESLARALKDQTEKQAGVEAAVDRLARLDHGIDIFERDLVSSRQLLNTARSEYESADKSLHSVDTQLQQRQTAGAPDSELSDLQARRGAIEEELKNAGREVDWQSDRVTKSEATVNHLKKTRVDAAEKVREARSEARSARNTVTFYESPLAPHRLRWWATVKGPRVLGVVLAMVVFWWLARIAAHRLVAGAVRRGRRGTQAEREGRAETLRRAFQSGASAAILVLGLLAVLHEAGIDVTVLLGGTAVVGAAIAFGSQNMVHDYFGGFMILIENQYSVGNVIRVGDITGTVEGLTLRMTSVRDLEGVVHFIPHSQVSQVSNLTYGWSRIVLDIRVAADQDADRVMAVLMEVARGLTKDVEFGPQLIDEPQMLGVDSLAGSAMSIKLLVKTQPLKRWAVKRELLRRIKKKLDEVGIKLA